VTIGVRLISPGGDSEYHAVPSKFIVGEKVLVVYGAGFAHGVFRSASRTSAGTTAIVTPPPGGRIALTDLIITTDKTANSDVTVRFTDGTDTVDVMVADSANNTVNLAIAFAGNWEGWVDARLEMVTTQSVTATVAVGYMILATGLAFAEWDGLR